MKILLAVDSSGSFVGDERWENTKKIVNETVKALKKTSEVEIVKVRSNELAPVSLEEFNEGWDFQGGDGGGLDEKLLNGLGYDKVLFITDGFVELTNLDDKVAVMILEDPDYVEDPQPIVGYMCEHCDRERGLHQAKDKYCPEPKGMFSRVNKFSPNLSKPIRRFTI